MRRAEEMKRYFGWRAPVRHDAAIELSPSDVSILQNQELLNSQCYGRSPLGEVMF